LETFEIRDEEIDVEVIMRKIRENIRKRKEAGIYPEGDIEEMHPDPTHQNQVGETGPVTLSPEARRDLLDFENLKDYLKNSLVAPEAKEELLGYIDEAFYRIVYTLDLVPKINDGRLLEIGANPYFITLLIKKYRDYKISTTNYFGDDFNVVPQVIENHKYGEKHVFDYTNINIETTLLPYPDGYFDVVLFCEVVEHLTSNPIFALYNIHKVLKTGGILIISTPNVYRYENIYKNISNRQYSIYDPYSSYGIYGRHNREYSLFEIEDIVSKIGFEILSKKTLYSKEKGGLIRKIFSAMAEYIDIGDYIIITATKKDGFRWYSPQYLFRGPTKRVVVNNYIIMGDNCSIQIGNGWHDIEFWEDTGDIRWTKKQCTAFLRPKGTEKKLYLNFLSPSHNYKLDIIIHQKNSKIGEYVYVVKKGWQKLTLDLTLTSSDVVQVDIVVDKAWTPKEFGISEDARELGMAVRELGLIE